MLAHLRTRIAPFAVPELRPTVDGAAIARTPGPDGGEHLVRLLTYVPGVCLGEVTPRSAALDEQLGRLIATLDMALLGFSHPDMHRAFYWDVRRAPEVRSCLDLISDSKNRTLVAQALDRFEASVLPRLASLRAGVIYNDGNDRNVLVDQPTRPERQVVGVIDFGDIVHGPLVSDLAVAATYAMLGRGDPISTAAGVVRGYDAVLPLEDSELDVLYELIRARLCMSVALSAYQHHLAPSNAHLRVSETAAWDLLERLSRTSESWALCCFRAASGREAWPHRSTLVGWATDHPDAIGPVVDVDLRHDPVAVFDLSVGSTDIESPESLEDVATWTAAIFERMRAAGARVGIGRYNEARPCYTGSQFVEPGNDGAAQRTIHLGIDLFMPAGAAVFAPLDGVVESVQDNPLPLDYGPTVILRHGVADGRLTFYTLYGHLSRESLEGLIPNKVVRRGERIGGVGSTDVNGGWPPHLHFQLIGDLLGRSGDFPGVGTASHRAVWLSLCPDPNLLLGMPLERFPPRHEGAEQIAAARRERLGPSLSLSYRRPLAIARGFMQYLYDDTGRGYLDAVNNVPTVGHSHPRVVEAARRQLAVLNTNTRYLHENLARYIERLCDTLPAPLSIAFLVNSGSEANDLALRLARTHTGGTDVVVIDGAYHGNTTALIEISPYKFAGPGGRGKPAHTHVVMRPDPYRGHYRGRGVKAGAAYAAHVREAIAAARASGRSIAAFVCEPLLAAGGQIVLPDGYLREAFRWARDPGAVCIADEVQVGLGRVGTHFWGFETQGVVPDIVTMGKPIGNGFPLGAVVTTPEIAASFANGMEYFNTFGGNPVSCGVGLAVLEVIEREGLQQRAHAVGKRLLDGLARLAERHPIIGDVRGLGLFLGVELVRDRETLAPAPEQAAYVAERMKDRGVLLTTEGPLHNVLKIKPPLVFSEENADHLVETLDGVLAEDFVRAATT